MELNYLKDLGYTDEEVKEYTNRWSSGIIEYLAENSEFVTANMKILIKDFDKELSLKLPIFYPDTFASDPSLFESRIILLKSAFPSEWKEIIENQFGSSALLVDRFTGNPRHT